MTPRSALREGAELHASVHSPSLSWTEFVNDVTTYMIENNDSQLSSEMISSPSCTQSTPCGTCYNY
jgi:hypothetical protein